MSTTTTRKSSKSAKARKVPQPIVVTYDQDTETKSFTRFLLDEEHRGSADHAGTVVRKFYLSPDSLSGAGIDPDNGITATITQYDPDATFGDDCIVLVYSEVGVTDYYVKFGLDDGQDGITVPNYYVNPEMLTDAHIDAGKGITVVVTEYDA